MVCETLNLKSGIAARSRLVRVDLPAPEGEEMMRGSGLGLFNVLDLFAKTLYFALHIDDEMSDWSVLRF